MKNLQHFLIIALGGGFGSVCRYLAQLGFSRLFGAPFPFLGTLVVNLSGCFLIGLLYGLAPRHAWLTLDWRLLLITGVCGGYTTFSTFSYESLNLLRQGNYFACYGYIVASLVFGLLATWAGMSLVR